MSLMEFHFSKVTRPAPVLKEVCFWLLGTFLVFDRETSLKSFRACYSQEAKKTQKKTGTPEIFREK